MPVEPGRLVTGTGLRLRAAPEADAAVIDKIALGSVLPCLQQSKPVTIGAQTAPFCQMERGWYFTALTEPVQSDRAAQLDRLIDKRAGELASDVTKDRWPDIYQVHALMFRRIADRSGEQKLAARLVELSFVSAHANAFHADPRVAADDSQGPRVKNEAFEQLVKNAKGTAAHEDAAWALYQHGWGGECEGYLPCVLTRAHRTACTFLASFPKGERARLAVADIITTLKQQAALEATNDVTDPSPSSAAAGESASARQVKQEARAALLQLESCVKKAQSGDVKKALEHIAATQKRLQ